MTFAEKLRELREKAGLTQTQLAKASDLPLGSLRNYEQGQREPYWDVVFKLVRALGTDCAAFADCAEAQAAATASAPKQGRPRKPTASSGAPLDAKAAAKKKRKGKAT